MLSWLKVPRLKYLKQGRVRDDSRFSQDVCRRKAVNRITFLRRRWRRRAAVSSIYILSPLSGKSNSLLDSRGEGAFRGIQPPRREIQSCTRSGLRYGIMALYLHARSISPFRDEGVTATDYIIFFDIKAGSPPLGAKGVERVQPYRVQLWCASVDRIGYLRAARDRGVARGSGVCADQRTTLGYLIVTIVWIDETRGRDDHAGPSRERQ